MVQSSNLFSTCKFPDSQLHRQWTTSTVAGIIRWMISGSTREHSGSTRMRCSASDRNPPAQEPASRAGIERFLLGRGRKSNRDCLTKSKGTSHSKRETTRPHPDIAHTHKIHHHGRRRRETKTQPAREGREGRATHCCAGEPTPTKDKIKRSTPFLSTESRLWPRRRARSCQSDEG